MEQSNEQKQQENNLNSTQNTTNQNEELLTTSFIGDKQIDQDKILAFLNKTCNIDDEEESDYEEAQTTNQLRREGKISRGRRPFLPPTTSRPSQK